MCRQLLAASFLRAACFEFWLPRLGSEYNRLLDEDLISLFRAWGILKREDRRLNLRWLLAETLAKMLSRRHANNERRISLPILLVSFGNLEGEDRRLNLRWLLAEAATSH